MNNATFQKNVILSIIIISYLMIVLDISIVITALPKISESLLLSATELSWVQSAYTLTFGGILLLGARTGDILGRKRMFITGLAIFTASSFVIGISQSALVLILARAIQGIGAAVLAPSSLALLATNFAEGSERTKAVAAYGAVAGIGASIGLVLGGVLADLISWRVGFFINLPIGIILLVGAKKYLQETDLKQSKFDVIGAIASTIAMSALVYSIVRSADSGWHDQITLTTFVIGLALLVYFIFHEKNAEQPIMPLRLFASSERSGAYLARFLFLGGMMGFWFFMTQFLQRVMGFNPFEAGLSFLPMTITNFLVAISVPKLTKKLGNARLLATGLAITFVGIFWLSHLSVSTAYLTGIALPMILIGIGQGCSLSPLTVSGVADVSKEDAGAASGLVNVAHQMGASLGLSILVAIFAAVAPVSADKATALAEQISIALTAAAGMMALALVVVMFMVVPISKIHRNLKNKS
jgi:EmrB/QacA subfamily drug resistance transporter